MVAEKFGELLNVGTVNQRYWEDGDHFYDKNDNKWRIEGGEGYDYFVGRAKLLLDANCQPVRDPENHKVCGNLTIKYAPTPISLIWDELEAKNLPESLVKFDLELGSSTEWYSWKASAAKPLLVLDRDETGQIRDASQLFGSWTFGGQNKTARLNGTKTTAKAWDNGYQALATLDANLDNVISGVELDGLSLWFDKNQNGISEKGEVKTLTKAGVTKLWFNNLVTENNGDITASIGFERTTKDGTITGSSVDWMSEGSSSLAEMLLKGTL